MDSNLTNFWVYGSFANGEVSLEMLYKWTKHKQK